MHTIQADKGEQRHHTVRTGKCLPIRQQQLRLAQGRQRARENLCAGGRKTMPALCSRLSLSTSLPANGNNLNCALSIENKVGPTP